MVCMNLVKIKTVLIHHVLIGRLLKVATMLPMFSLTFYVLSQLISLKVASTVSSYNNFDSLFVNTLSTANCKLGNLLELEIIKCVHIYFPIYILVNELLMTSHKSCLGFSSCTGIGRAFAFLFATELE